MKYDYIENASILYKEISNLIKNDKKYYLFLGEIQEVKEWEKTINSFLVDYNIDIYITGSNSKLLSSELAIYIARRYVEIPIYPLSFKEHLRVKRWRRVTLREKIISLYKDIDIAGILENIVYLELKKRGYNVCIGQLDDKEIDFIHERRDEKIYIQVAYKLSSEETIKGEFGSLLAVKDHYPKYIVTMDEFFQDNIEGVKHVNLLDFLMELNIN